MESRSYRGMVYDDHFRLKVVAMHTHAIWCGLGHDYSSKYWGVSPLSVYKWKNQILNFSHWTDTSLNDLGEFYMREMNDHYGPKAFRLE